MSTRDGAISSLSESWNESMKDRDELRRASRSMYNRLRSIAHDAEFVRHVAQRLPTLPFVPNERAGSWYVDPSLRASRQTEAVSVYFKSTDGHTGKWDFNLRRLNHHAIQLAAQRGGIVIVDVTRRGKRFPDSLAKTIPLWCAVINRAIQFVRTNKMKSSASQKEAKQPLAQYSDQTEHDGCNVWDAELHCPSSVPKTEIDQMADMIDAFSQRLISSSIDVSALSDMLAKPLRPVWITPVTRMFACCNHGQPLWEDPIADLAFIPIVCVSASIDPLQLAPDEERILPLPTDFAYVQGASDDSELWASGFTSTMFWQHLHDLHLETSSPGECERQVMDIIASHRESQSMQASLSRIVSESQFSMKDSQSSFNWIGNTGIAVGSFHAAAPPHCWTLFDVIINCGAREFAENSIHKPGSNTGKLYVYLDIPEGKKGQNKLYENIPVTIQSVCGRFMAAGRRILVHCMQGKDRSVGICLALLLEYMDESGTMTCDGLPCRSPRLSKETIRNRLLQIQCSRPVASPSRATLKKINLYFLGKEESADA